MMYHIARRIEDYFGKPQDIEWAMDRDRRLVILQSRPMVFGARTIDGLETFVPPGEPLLSGGYSACPGIGSGPVFPVRSESDLDRFPDGAVLVSRHSSPVFSQVMKRCAGIVTDVGSPTGHMAILAREFSVPTIVGIERATRLLESERIVTVDAINCRVFDGVVPFAESCVRMEPPLANSPAVEILRKIARFVTPLHLIDPSAQTFKPGHCRSIHDITRFIHEKVFDIMFNFGELTVSGGLGSFKLDVHLPFEILLFDVGDGLARKIEGLQILKPDDIQSVPLKAFLEGLLDPKIQWNRPRPVSASGFLSVLGESLSAPPAEAQQLGRISYTIISDRYMNFSTKAGYHFSTLDTYCGHSQNKNYIHFRFAGGAAAGERRARRIKFLSIVLTKLDFKIQARSDLLVARLEKYERAYICSRLTEMGRLTMCARQLDMLMDSDSSPEFFARAFLSGDMDKFY
jgi:pyruvate,water dikinase